MNAIRGENGDDFAKELGAHVAMNSDRGVPGLESLRRDLQYSVRSLARNPLITAVAVLSIGLGIGSNSTTFSIVSRFVLRPAPVGDPDTLLSLHILQDGDRCCNQFSWPVFTDLHKQATVFTDAAAYFDLVPASMSGNSGAERVWGQGVTPNFFRVAELPMVVGAGFSDSDEDKAVVVLSERLWKRRFNSDKSIIGRTVTLSGHTFTVTGIAPGAFHSIDQILNAEFWVPLSLVPQTGG